MKLMSDTTGEQLFQRFNYTWEALGALKKLDLLSANSYASLVLFKLPACIIDSHTKHESILE